MVVVGTYSWIIFVLNGFVLSLIIANQSLNVINSLTIYFLFDNYSYSIPVLSWVTSWVIKCIIIDYNFVVVWPSNTTAIWQFAVDAFLLLKCELFLADTGFSRSMCLYLRGFSLFGNLSIHHKCSVYWRPRSPCGVMSVLACRILGSVLYV